MANGRIEFNAQSVKWRIRFRYGTQRVTDVTTGITKAHRVTRCMITEIPVPKWNAFDSFCGEAVCSPHDKFDRKIGRKLALTRAIKWAAFSREDRRAAWKAYLERRNV